MKLTKDDHEKVIKILKMAYHEKEKVEVGAQWHQKVMRDIRHLGPLCSDMNGYALFDRFFWRVAPVICLVMLIIGALAINVDFMSELELSSLFTDDPFVSTTIDSFFM